MLPELIMGGASIVSGLFGSKGAKKAARAQADAMRDATWEQRRQYDQTREDMAPWRAAGENALAKLLDPQSSFEASPGYQFRLDQGREAIERSAAARGGLASGNTLAALTEYGQGLGSQEYGNWWNQQAGLAGAGQGATNQLAVLGQNTANNIGNLITGAGNARASGIIGSANAWGNTINDLATGFGDWWEGRPKKAGSTGGSVSRYAVPN